MTQTTTHEPRTTSLLFFSFVALFLLASCQPAMPITPTNPATKGGPTKIGLNIALTGSFAMIGTNEKRGAEMALSDINAKGGINGVNLTFIIEDNQGDAKTAVTAQQKMLDTDKIDAGFTAFTHITQAIAPLMKNAGKVLVYHSTVPDMAKANAFVFRDYYDISRHGGDLGAYAISQGYTTFSYLGDTSDVCDHFVDSFSKAISGHGSIILNQTFESSEKDFKTMLLKAKDAGAQANLFCVWKQEDILMRQLEQEDMLSTPSFHAAAPFLPSSQTVSAQFRQNHAVSSWYGFTASTTDAKVNDFKARYRALYHEEPIPDAMYAYDDIMHLSQAIASCGKEQSKGVPACVSTYLIQHPYTGIAGTIAYSQDRVSIRPTLLIRYGENGWEDVV